MQGELLKICIKFGSVKTEGTRCQLSLPGINKPGNKLYEHAFAFDDPCLKHSW